MTSLICSAVRRRLPALHDRELSIEDRLALEAHVADCARCAGDLGNLRAVGEAVRLVAVPARADQWAGLQPDVMSRMRAEAEASWAARAARAWDDRHLVWIGLAATAATFLCGVLALGALQLGSTERDDSLAAMIAVISAPSGSDLNPVRVHDRLQVPTVPVEGAIEIMLAQPVRHDEIVLALRTVVTREGRVSGVSVLNTEPHPHEVNPILHVLSHARFEPGRVGTSPVAVNFVWLVAHTTVRAKAPPLTSI